MKKSKRAEGKSSWRRGIPELAAMLVTGFSLLAIATMGGSSAQAGTTARIEKPPAVVNASGGSVAPQYADAERDVLDLQLD
jgi:hypothetical protein